MTQEPICSILIGLRTNDAVDALGGRQREAFFIVYDGHGKQIVRYHYTFAARALDQGARESTADLRIGENHEAVDQVLHEQKAIKHKGFEDAYGVVENLL